MDFESVKAWLDENIAIRKRLVELDNFNEEMQLCTVNKENTLHVYKGIEIIAELLGKVLVETEFDDDIPYKYYFMYDGVEVFQLSRERLV